VGRALFAKDELFGQWMVTANLSDTNQAERAAAMWAAANQGQFEQASEAGNARAAGNGRQMLVCPKLGQTIKAEGFHPRPHASPRLRTVLAAPRP